MMEPNNESASDLAGSDIELQNVNSNNHNHASSMTTKNGIPELEASAATTATTTESSMDIEQSVPTVAELRGKSESDLIVPRRRRGAAFYALLVLPFLVIAFIVVVVVATVHYGDKNATTTGTLSDADRQKQQESFEAVVKYIGNNDISDFPELIREGSNQNLAARWMAQDDPEQRRIPKGSPASKEGYSFMQRYIMALFYFQMGGENWKYDLNFLSDADTCEWFKYIVGTNSDYPMGARCNRDELIVELIFVGVNLKGSFPTELAKLTTLRTLEMDLNDISGSIPSAFHTLVNLEYFHLSHNQFVGSLPRFFGSFPDLITIDVSFNQMDGTLPTELATMDKLRGIAIDNNLFSGDLAFWWEWPKAEVSYQQTNLEYLFLEHNMLTGRLDDKFINKMPNLKVLDASDNQLGGGPLPMDLFRLSAVQVIDFHSNAFTGPIPDGIPANTALQFLALHKNKLSGTIPESIGNFQMLKQLDVSTNKLTGYGTNSNSNAGLGLGSLKKLTYLFLAENEFEAAPFPEFLRSMTDLEELSLKSLKLDGTIPSWIGELTNLVLLDIANCELRGSIPSEIGKLSKLQFLLLNRNELSEEVPVEVGDLKALRLFYIDSNALQGNLNMICDRPQSVRSPIMVADCGGANLEVDCDCCAKCCVGSEHCNDDNLVPSNDPMWQFGYDRVFYSFGNFTGYFFDVRT